jgi:hypothetical protein
MNFQAEFDPEKFTVLTECGSETSNLVLMKLWLCEWECANVLKFMTA